MYDSTLNIYVIDNTQECVILNLYFKIVYDSVLNMCVIENTVGMCHLKKMLILPYESN